MDSKKMMTIFNKKMNVYLNTVDFPRLDQSCNSADNTYAKEILKDIHDMFVKVYGTDYIDYEHEFVNVPAIIQGRETGHTGLGLVSLDLESSGEHCGTYFFTPLGVINHGSQKNTKKESNYINETYVPYNYWYTMEIEDDIHLDFDDVPDKINEFINYCRPDQPGMKME